MKREDGVLSLLESQHAARNLNGWAWEIPVFSDMHMFWGAYLSVSSADYYGFFGGSRQWELSLLQPLLRLQYKRE